RCHAAAASRPSSAPEEGLPAPARPASRLAPVPRAEFGRSRSRAMVNGDVPRQARSLECLGHSLPHLTECRGQEVDGGLHRVELPEAVHHADLEASCQKWTGALAPGAVFGPLAVQARYVVPPVLVDHELSAAGPEDAVDLGLPSAIYAPERRPQADDDVGRRVRSLDRAGRPRGHRREPRARGHDAVDDRAARGVDDEDVAIRDGAEGVERRDELAGTIEGANEPSFELTR